MNTDKPETVTILKADYDQLIKDQEMLNALEAGGVDNWEWYDESLTDWRAKFNKFYP